MVVKLKIFSLIIFVFLIGFSSCNDYKKLMKSTDYEKKYERAMQYYEKNDFARAQTVFEELRTIFRGTEKAENVSYYYAKSTYGIGEYTLAGYLFKDFTRQFRASSRAEECQFLSAYCYYLLSPSISLEQIDTETSIAELQYFIEKYPNSEKKAEAEKCLDELQNKLELKAYNNAMLYHTIGDYKAAIVALKNVSIDFPDTQHREKILFTIIEDSYLLAKNSIYSKQKERYKNTIDAYYKFVDNYPNSNKIKEAEKYYTNSLKFIESKYGQ
ncbi:MAG: outer membrane protein assembly factor BamD [Bacteroidales bacterium]|jgi:outer membrane protein assembly factor BamD|nr:outer membrane protein assembly factor BamD [Bacteroidales bacterium]